MITGVLFSLLQGILAYFAFRYGDKGGDGARYWIRPRLEKRFALIVGIIIFGVDVTLFALGDSNWFRAWRPSPPGRPIVEVMGEQFTWNFSVCRLGRCLWNTFVSYAAFALASAQLIFIFNLIWSLFRGPQAMKNPWKANTLEWTAPAPIPHWNWDGPLQTVYRWALRLRFDPSAG
ncbi:MAG: hypothetical protein DMG14_29450 [Acidobacteria bacterium]|nr:MAG: hypothetical protein DMG14_29450 [Acidobacteriota bacterium]